MRSPFRGLPRAFVVLWWGMLVNRLGGFVVPFLAIYLTSQRGFSVERVGLILSLYGAGSVLAGPLGGWLSDRLGRKAVMVTSLCLGACSVLSLAAVQRGPAVALAVFCVSFLGDMYRPACSAMVADLIPDQRQRAFGLVYWAINLGFSGAMIVAGALMRFGFLVLFTADAATSLAFAVLVALFVPETRPEGGTAHPLHIAAPFRDGGFVAFFLLMLGIAIIYSQAHCTLPVDMQRHGISAAGFGYIIAINGVMIAILQPWVGQRLGRLPPARVLALNGLLTGVGFGIQALAGGAPIYVAAIVVWTLGEIIGAPMASTVVASLSPASLRGTYQGALQTAWGGGAFLAPMLGGFAMGSFGGPALWVGCMVLGCLVGLGHWLVTGAILQRRSARNFSMMSGQPQPEV
ncbi:MAG: MFS transporter [Elusimicrobia bacterium]|nr:MFS transporter [Elusimicrobiota bacterium]